MEKYSTRSSILKRPVSEESSPTFTRSTRRISFSGKKNVKEFMPGDGGATIWITSYEESAEVAPANSMKGKLYGGPHATPELIMRLRNNKVISKIPQKVNSKPKKSKNVKIALPANTHNEEEEQLNGKFCDGMDTSLSVSGLQKLIMNKVEGRLPLRPITQHFKQSEEAESYVSPQTSLTFSSPGKFYCSFPLLNNESRKLQKLNFDKTLDLTLADIMRDSNEKILHGNKQFNNLGVNLTPMVMGNEGNISKPKRETMLNLENMELVSIQKSPNKRATIYYYDTLELSLKNCEKQRISFSRLKQLNTSNGNQVENVLVEDCDKENREVDVDNTNMDLSFPSIVDSMKFDSEKNVEIKVHRTHSVNNTKTKYDINKEKQGYIENDDNVIENINRLEMQLSVHDFAAQGESDLDKMDISLSPGALIHSMQGLRNQETMHQSYGLNLTLENEIITNEENKLTSIIKVDETAVKGDQENEIMDIPATNAIGYSSNDAIDRSLRRQTVNIPCNLDLTLQDDKLHINEKSLGSTTSNRQLCFNKTSFSDASPTILMKNGLNLAAGNYNNESDNLQEGNIKCAEKRRTILKACDLDLTLQEERQGIVDVVDNKSNGLITRLDSTKCLEKRRTIFSCDLDLTLENESQMPNTKIVDANVEEGIQSRSKLHIKSTEKRLSVHNACDLDLTLENSVQLIDDKEKSEDVFKKSSDEVLKPLEKRRTVYNTGDLDLTLENTAQLTDKKLVAMKSGKYLPARDYDFTLDNTAQLVDNKLFDKKSQEMYQRPSVEKVKFSEKRHTLYNTCDLDLTLEDDKKFNDSICDYNKGQIFENGLEMDMEMEICTNILPQSSFTWGEKQMPHLEGSFSKGVARQNTEELIKISKEKRRTIHTDCDLNFTLPTTDHKTSRSEAKNPDIKSDQCVNLSVEKSPILVEENKVSGDEQFDSKVKRQTLHNHLDLDFTLEEKIPIKCTKQADSNRRDVEKYTNFSKAAEHEMQNTNQTEKANFGAKRHIVSDQDLTLKMASKISLIKSPDLHLKEESVETINAIDCDILHKTSQYERENCKMRQSVYTPLDMDMEEKTGGTYIKQVDLKKNSENSLKLKTEKIIQSSSNEQQMNSSISFRQPVQNDLECMKRSLITASANSGDEYFPKKNLIFSAKRQTIYEPCDLDISMQDESAKIAKSDDKVALDLKTITETDDYDGIKCILENNAENNTNSSIKCRMSCSSVNFDLTIQNDLKDSKNGEVNNDQGHYIQPDIEPFTRTERLSCLPIKTKTTPKREKYSAAEPMPKISTQDKTPNMLNKSPAKNSVEILDFSVEECTKSSELANTQILSPEHLKSAKCNMEINSLRNIDLSGCEQLDQTSEVLFYDLSSSNGTIDLEIERLRNAESVTETSPEIPKLIRASSCHTNTTNSTFSANTTKALCNFDLNKITKKGYKANLRATSDFANSSHIFKKSKATSFDNSYDYIPPTLEGDQIQKVNVSIGNLNLNCITKDLKSDNCENKLNNQQAVESKSTIDGQQSFCSRCKVCECKPNRGENNTDISTFCWKFEAPPQPCEVDFSRYEKFHNLPSIRDVLNAHKRRRESLNFESYDESVLCPMIPSLDFLLENYEKQYKLQVEKELPIGAILPLTPSLEILLSNKLQSEHIEWKLNTLFMPVGVMEFRHNIIPSVTLILKYSPKSFYSNEDKIIFEKVQLKISKLYGNCSPFNRIIENEICVKAPYDLINYCSCFNDLFNFLSLMNTICEKAVQLGKELFRRVVGFNGSIEKDNSDVCFIKKKVLYSPCSNQKVLMSTKDFLVRVRNIDNISYTDIMLPPLSDFKESVSLIPEGLEFLTKFFYDPISYLKTKS